MLSGGRKATLEAMRDGHGGKQKRQQSSLKFRFMVNAGLWNYFDFNFWGTWIFLKYLCGFKIVWYFKIVQLQCWGGFSNLDPLWIKFTIGISIIFHKLFDTWNKILFVTKIDLTLHFNISLYACFMRVKKTLTLDDLVIWSLTTLH